MWFKRSSKEETLNSELEKEPTKIRKFIIDFVVFGLFFTVLAYLFAFDFVLPGRLFRLPLIVVIPIGIVVFTSLTSWLLLKFGILTKKKTKTKAKRPWTRREIIRFITIMAPIIALCVLGLWISNAIYQANYNRDLALARQDFIVTKEDPIQEKQVESTLITLERGMSSARTMLGVRTHDVHTLYLFSDAESMQNELKLNARVGGLTTILNGQIYIVLPAEQPQSSLSNNVITTTPKHEAIHVVIYEILGEDGNSLDRWFNEGVARYEELKGFYYIALVERYYERFVLWRGVVPATPEQLLFSPSLTSEDFDRGCYYTSYELVRYIVRTHGEDALVNIVKLFAQEKDFDKAFKKALGVSPEEIYDQWAQEFF